MNTPDSKIDWFGGVASGLCAVHCGVCALLPAAFGVLGLGFLLGHEVEWAFTLVAIAIATLALVHGWRQHRSWLIATMLAVGIAGLLASRVVEMGGHHDAHHADGHVEASHTDHHDSEGSHDDHDGHLLGAAFGIPAGLLMVLGHAMNFSASRRCRNEECSCGGDESTQRRVDEVT